MTIWNPDIKRREELSYSGVQNLSSSYIVMQEDQNEQKVTISGLNKILNFVYNDGLSSPSYSGSISDISERNISLYIDEDTDFNPTGWTEGDYKFIFKHNPGLYFDGANDYVSFGNQTDFNFAKNSPFSMSCFVKTTDSSGSLISKFVSLNGWLFYLSTAGNPRFQYQLGANSVSQMSWISDTSVNDDSWHHVCVTYDGSQAQTGINIYVDGVLTNGSGPGWTLTNGDPSLITAGLFLGISNTTQTPLQGKLKRCKVWIKELSSKEVALEADYQNISDSLLAWWDLNEGTGTAINDSSLNDYSGTITGATWSTDSLNVTSTTIDGLLPTAFNGNEVVTIFYDGETLYS